MKRSCIAGFNIKTAIHFRNNSPQTKFFVDINFKIINIKLYFDVYHEPTNSFSYPHYKSCHRPHTKNNIALSLARRVCLMTCPTCSPVSRVSCFTCSPVSRASYITCYLALRASSCPTCSRTSRYLVSYVLSCPTCSRISHV